MREIMTIGYATFGEAIRRRILVIFLLFAIVSIVGSQIFKAFSPGEEEKFVVDLGLNSIKWFSILIAWCVKSLVTLLLTLPSLLAMLPRLLLTLPPALLSNKHRSSMGSL